MNRIEWYTQNKQVVLQTFEGKTTLDDFMDIATQSAEMLNSVSHPVQLIVDRTRAFFTSFQPTELKELNTIVPDNQDIVIVVGADHNTEMLSNIVGSRLYPRAFKGTYYVKTLQEAHEILKQERNIDLV